MLPGTNFYASIISKLLLGQCGAVAKDKRSLLKITKVPFKIGAADKK
jgi:hypothetical protein